jgi:hypothetical protein
LSKRVPFDKLRADQLNNRAPQLNAPLAGQGSPEGKESWCAVEGPWEAAAMRISIWIEGSQPLVGTAAIEGVEPLRFDGWLELLRVVSKLVDTALVDTGPHGGEDTDMTEIADAKNTDEGPLYPDPPRQPPAGQNDL